jgi:hypothetical protein
MSRRLRISALALAAAALASPVTHADILAATCVRAPAGGQHVAIVNASLGTRVALPQSVNTENDVGNPGITTDGRRLLFRRSEAYGFAGLREVVVIDLVSGQSATLFTRTDVQFNQDPFFFSSIKPDGSQVFTGRNFPSSNGHAFAQAWLSNFPTSTGFPSFTQSTVTAGFDFHGAGSVVGVAAGNRSLLAMVVRASGRDQLLLHQIGVGSSAPLSDALYEYSQPAIAGTNSQIVLFRQRRIDTVDGRKVFLPGDIRYRPAAIDSFAGEPIGLTGTGAGVNTFEHDESQPAITADGRYVAFVRDAPNANDRLFVWDSQTQTLLNPNGIDLGITRTAEFCGSTSLYVRQVINSSVISGSGRVNASLQLASSIGIFVQRIVGKTKVLGKKAYELETVGRVPLGSYGAGNVFTSWDFAVDGEPLPPGRYLVTVRAVEGTIVRELGESQVLRVDARGRAHLRGMNEAADEI